MKIPASILLTVISAFIFLGNHNQSYANTTTLIGGDNAVKITNKNKPNQEYKQPTYHFLLPKSNTTALSGLVYFKDKYHLFYQQIQQTQDNNEFFISHVQSDNLINWERLKTAVISSTDYDKKGIIAGSSIVSNDMLHILYTGKSEKKDGDQTKIIENQNLAMSKDGINFGKSANNPVINQPPHYAVKDFSSENFRNPFVWQNNNIFYSLVSSQYEKTKDAAVLLFKSKDLRNWDFVNITAIGKNGEMGETWEHPSLVHFNDKDVLILSTTGLKPQGNNYLNNQHSGWFIGNFDYESGRFKQKSAFGLLDYGFDFYSPQITKTQDNRVIMLGKIGNNKQNKSDSNEFPEMFSIPRELKLIDNKIYTTPARELLGLRDSSISYKNILLYDSKSFPNIHGNAYELELNIDLSNANNFELKFKVTQTQEIVLSFDKSTKTLKLDRTKSGKGLDGTREVKLNLQDNTLSLDIFVDKYSMEIFAQNGQVAMSTIVNNEKMASGISLHSDGQVKINSIDFYKFDNLSEKTLDTKKN